MRLQDLKRVASALLTLEKITSDVEGSEDWSLLANATGALQMILDRNPLKF